MPAPRPEPARPGLPVAPLAIAFAFVCADPGSAAPTYTVGFTSGYVDQSVSSATPFRRDSSYALQPSNGTGIAAGHGVAMPLMVGAAHRIDVTWASGLSGAFSSGSYARATSDDFIITGPAAPTSVAATLNLRLSGTFGLGGGFAGNGGHQAVVAVRAQATGAFWPFAGIAQIFGDYSYTNAGPYSSGCLAGVSGSSIDVPLALSGNFPVNVPFVLSLRVEARDAGYGNVFTNPGFAEANVGSGGSGGLRFDSVAGQVMTLPAGYTLNSASWGITNNAVSLVAVESAPALDRPSLEVTGANPFVGVARLALSLPRAAAARVAIYDAGGRAIRTLFDGWAAAGRHELRWDGRTTDGTPARTGLYFVGAEYAGERVTRRIVRLQ